MVSLYWYYVLEKRLLMRKDHKIAAISVVGLLTLAMISAVTINSLPLAKAEPYGQKVSREAKADDRRNGFGDQIQDQINPKDNKGIGQEYRQAGVNARGGDDAPGNSGEDHGNNPDSNN